MNWIWLKSEKENTFAEFERKFTYDGGDAELFISADYRYVAYLNGKTISFGQYADLPTYKSVDRKVITPYLQRGENVLRVLAWHGGQDFAVCRAMAAGIAFEIVVGGNKIAQSDKNTLCREANGYRKGDKVTPQIGYGFHYDFSDSEGKWKPSKEIKAKFEEVARPAAQLNVGELCTPKICAQGVFDWNKGYKKQTIAAQMQNAWLSSMRFADMTGENRLQNDRLTKPLTFRAKGGEGIFVLADMGKETCGYLGFTVSVDKPCKMALGWGEHLSDLRIRTEREGRNFGVEFNLKAGENVFDDYLLRLGCRYLCIFVEGEAVTLSRLGIREVGYPFAFPKKDFKDRLLNQIYETGRRTLYLCAHEHYEDCPWREQALYGMDSRNQMLFGYGAFEEYDFPRANLLLIAKSMQEDGLIQLCAPARASICIPSFTAFWLIAIAENAKANFSQPFVKEILPDAEAALAKLLLQEGEDGLSLFTAERYWNFHEWSEGLDGGEIFRSAPIEPCGDFNLTALTVIAAKGLAEIETALDRTEKAKEWTAAAERLSARLENYYDELRGLYASYVKNGKKSGFHAYTQALALLTGAVPASRVKHLCKAIKDPKEYDLVPATLAALQLQYQALIEYGKDINYCVEEVVKIFGKMLYSGATSYWETENGEADFDDAGSLCHGWSAVACWVLDKYAKK